MKQKWDMVSIHELLGIRFEVCEGRLWNKR